MPASIGPKVLAGELGVNENAVKQMLKRAGADAQVTKASRGRYVLNTSPERLPG